jgi:hypothetical protein
VEQHCCPAAVQLLQHLFVGVPGAWGLLWATLGFDEHTCVNADQHHHSSNQALEPAPPALLVGKSIIQQSCGCNTC